MIKPTQNDAFPSTEPHYRATFSFPAQLAKDINRLAKRMGVSQSALLSELLAQPIAAMCEIIDTIPPTGATADDVKRARGKSTALIKEAVQTAIQTASLVDDADDDHR